MFVKNHKVEEKMKKNFLGILTALFCLANLFFVVSCEPTENPEIPKDESQEISNNLRESSGTNEVSGKTYASSSTGAKVYFEDSSMTIYSSAALSTSSANTNMRAISSSDVKQATYNYSYNSEDKTLELQLANLWDSNAAAITYKTQVETVKSTLENLASLIQAQFDTSKNTTYKSFIENLNKLDVANGTYGNTVATLITNKLNTYITNQETILEDYLQKKYNSTVKFSYDNPNSNLALTQQFQKDLTDASSEFTSDSYNVVLNGYDSLKPFAITLTPSDSSLSSKEFVGLPTFSTSGTTTTMSVDLYDYLGEDILAENFDASSLAKTKATELLTYVTSKLSAVTSDKTKAAALALEVQKDETTTVESWIDDIFDSQTLTATVTVDSVNSSEPKVTLTTTKDFSSQDGTYSLASGTAIELSYYPILSSTIAVDDLTLEE